jgi:hypothetical protein
MHRDNPETWFGRKSWDFLLRFPVHLTKEAGLWVTPIRWLV